MPAPLQDPVLGHLAWDDQLEWWIGKAELTPGSLIEVFIPPEGTPQETVLNNVRLDLERIRNREPEYRRWAAEHMVGDSWNTESEDLTVEEITNLLRLASISFHPGGGADLYWDDDERIYAGHNIVTDLDTEGNCVRMRMEG